MGIYNVLNTGGTLNYAWYKSKCFINFYATLGKLLNSFEPHFLYVWQR